MILGVLEELLQCCGRTGSLGELGVVVAAVVLVVAPLVQEAVVALLPDALLFYLLSNILSLSTNFTPFLSLYVSSLVIV